MSLKQILKLDAVIGIASSFQPSVQTPIDLTPPIVFQTAPTPIHEKCVVTPSRKASFPASGKARDAVFGRTSSDKPQQRNTSNRQVFIVMTVAASVAVAAIAEWYWQRYGQGNAPPIINQNVVRGDTAISPEPDTPLQAGKRSSDPSVHKADPPLITPAGSGAANRTSGNKSVPPSASAAAGDVKPIYAAGHSVRVRDAGMKYFGPMTLRVGVEFYHDPQLDVLIAISESGMLSIIPFQTTGADNKLVWTGAFELRVRPANEESFARSMLYGAEVYFDHASGREIIATSRRTLCWVGKPSPERTDRPPVWHHALVMKVRHPGEEKFDTAAKIGIEVYKDPCSLDLLYISEACYIGIGNAPTKAPDEKSIRAPRALCGFSIPVRNASQATFVEGQSKVFGVEAYYDPNSANVVFISEVGGIALINYDGLNGAVLHKPDSVYNATIKWKHGFKLKARKGGENTFDSAGEYGIEVYEIPEFRTHLYICENGSIAVTNPR